MQTYFAKVVAFLGFLMKKYWILDGSEFSAKSHDHLRSLLFPTTRIFKWQFVWNEKWLHILSKKSLCLINDFEHISEISLLALLEHSQAFHTKLCKTCSRNLILGEVVYIAIIYHIPDSWIFLLFYEWLRFLVWSHDWWKPRIVCGRKWQLCRRDAKLCGNF